MAKDPSDRYQSAAEMREDLLRARAGQAVDAPAVVETATSTALPSPVLLDQRRRRTARGLVLAAFLVLLVGIGAGTAVLVRSAVDATSDGFVPTPAVLGLDQRAAVRRLAQEGLRVGSITPRFDQAPFGQVLAQTPDPDFVVPERGTVDLVVSRGVETTVVPREVVGRPRAEAQVILADRKLTVAPEQVTQDGFYEAGTVLAVAPAPGRQVRAGSAVTLTVASGQVPLPDVEGRAQDVAVDALQAAGFDVRVEQQYTSGEPGRVLSQSPGQGAHEVGRTVTIAVSQALPPQPVPPAPSPAPAATPPQPATTADTG
jgi:serine/threonine-protein kinase